MPAETTTAIPWSNVVALLGFFAMVCWLGWIAGRLGEKWMSGPDQRNRNEED